MSHAYRVLLFLPPGRNECYHHHLLKCKLTRPQLVIGQKTYSVMIDVLTRCSSMPQKKQGAHHGVVHIKGFVYLKNIKSNYSQERCFKTSTWCLWQYQSLDSRSSAYRSGAYLAPATLVVPQVRMHSLLRCPPSFYAFRRFASSGKLVDVIGVTVFIPCT